MCDWGHEFVYLAVVLDVYSRRVIGWSLGRSLQTSLPLSALNQAIANRQPSPNLVHHSDWGTQYASDEYVQRLEQAGMFISMSRPARPWENAYASHCTSFGHSDRSGAVGRRLNSFVPCAFLGMSEPGGSYRHSGLSV